MDSVVVGAIIQARVSSTRFYGKVLRMLPHSGNITVLEHVINRLKKADKINKIVVATTENPEDVAIADIASRSSVACYRGSINDVLSRFYNAARENGIDIIVRITSDDPCIDPLIIDEIVNLHIKGNFDYTANHESGLPLGLNVEVISFNALEDAFKNATEAFEREHVCPYINNTRRDKFRIGALFVSEELKNPSLRVTLDTEADYVLLCAVYDFLYKKNQYFGAREIVELISEKPWLSLINKSVMQKRKYESFEEELAEAVKLLELQELKRVKDMLINMDNNSLDI